MADGWGSLVWKSGPLLCWRFRNINSQLTTQKIAVGYGTPLCSLRDNYIISGKGTLFTSTTVGISSSSRGSHFNFYHTVQLTQVSLKLFVLTHIIAIEY